MISSILFIGGYMIITDFAPIIATSIHKYPYNYIYKDYLTKPILIIT